jgi:hypothetical protein
MQPLALTLHAQQHAVPPAHHVLSRSALLPHWRPVPVATPGPSIAPEGASEGSSSSSGSGGGGGGGGGGGTLVRTGFRNPWPSWHTPTLREIWDGLSWRADETQSSSAAPGDAEEQLHAAAADDDKQAAAELAPLRVLAPDFHAPATQKRRVGATWLGHAGVLLQLPSLRSGAADAGEDDCVRLVCDPIFSDR